VLPSSLNHISQPLRQCASNFSAVLHPYVPSSPPRDPCGHVVVGSHGGNRRACSALRVHAADRFALPLHLSHAIALGNVGAGKSAVLNSLIGHPVLPTGEADTSHHSCGWSQMGGRSTSMEEPADRKGVALSSGSVRAVGHRSTSMVSAGRPRW
jgi:hypothetical protein